MTSQQHTAYFFVLQRIRFLRTASFSLPKRRFSALWRRLFFFSLLVISTGIVSAGMSNQANATALLPSHLTQKQSSPVNWDQLGYQDTRYNPSETILTPSNVSRLTPKWRTYVGDSVNSSPAVVNGSIYIGSYDGSMKAFNDSTGALLWNHQLPSLDFINNSSPAVANGFVYVGAFAPGVFYAFNAKTGAIAWSFQTAGVLDSSPTTYNNAVYFGSNDKHFYALQGNTGKLLWSFQTNGAFYESSPIIANGIAYFTVDGGTLYALNATSGKLLWKASGYMPLMPVYANGVLYASYFNGTRNMYAMAALNGNTGAVLWQTDLSTIYGRIGSSPALANGLVYISTDDSKTFALNASTGKIKWTYTNPVGTIFASAPLVANGVLFTGDVYGQFLALNATTGKVLWLYDAQGEVLCSPVVVNGALYIGSNSGLLYKFTLS